MSSKAVYFGIAETISFLFIFVCVLGYCHIVYVDMDLFAIFVSSLVVAPIISGCVAGYFFEKRYKERITGIILIRADILAYFGHLVILTGLFYVFRNNIDGIRLHYVFVVAFVQILLMSKSVIYFRKTVNDILFK